MKFNGQKYSYLKGLVILLSLFLITVLVGCGGDGGGGSNDTDGIKTGYSVKEITPEGGSITILDEYNNTIEATFPADALDNATEIYLGVVSKQSALQIETRHASIFEIKPYDLELYEPTTIRVSYQNSIQDNDKTALFRKKADILVPLDDHAFGADNASVEAQTFTLGIFAEGEMSLEQIDAQIRSILVSHGISWGTENTAIQHQFARTAMFTESWTSCREDVNGLIELLSMRSVWTGIPYNSASDPEICQLVEKCSNQAVREYAGAACDSPKTRSIFDALILTQHLECSTVSGLDERRIEIQDRCCINLYQDNIIHASMEGGGIEIELLSNGHFAAATSGEATSGNWSYNHNTIYLQPYNEELYTSQIYLNNYVCVGVKVDLWIPGWMDDDDVFHPSRDIALTVKSINDVN